jgi:hypothetical protein
MDCKKLFTGFIFCGGFVLLYGMFSVSALAADAYTDALDAEADNISVDPLSEKPAATAPPENDPVSSGWSQDIQSMSQDIPPSLGKEDFEEAMKVNFYGSYMFYNRLDDGEQQEVYDYYRKNPSIQAIRERIIELKKSH